MGVFSKIADVFKKIVRKVGKVIKKVTSPIRKVLRKVLKPFGKLFGKLGWVGTIALGIIFPGIGSMLGGWMQGLTKIVMAPFQWLGQAIAPNLTNFLSGVVKGLKTAGRNVFSSITETFKHGLNKIGQAFGFENPGNLEWLTQGEIDLMGDAGEGLKPGINSLGGGKAATLTESFDAFVSKTRDKFLGKAPGVVDDKKISKLAGGADDLGAFGEDYEWDKGITSKTGAVTGQPSLLGGSYDPGTQYYKGLGDVPGGIGGTMSYTDALQAQNIPLADSIISEQVAGGESLLSNLSGKFGKVRTWFQDRAILGLENPVFDKNGNPVMIRDKETGAMIPKTEPSIGTWGQAGSTGKTVMRGIDVYEKYIADQETYEAPWVNQNTLIADAMLETTNQFAPMEGLAFSDVPTNSRDTFNQVAGNYLTGFGYAMPSQETNIFNYAMNMPGYGYTFQDHVKGQVNDFLPDIYS